MYNATMKRFSLCTLPFVLIACGGGADPRTAGIEGSGAPFANSNGVVAIGAITAFGSIFVNGTEYSLSGSTIQVDGKTAAESDLKLGQVVTVIASQGASGTTVRAAKSVAASIAVAGRVSAIDLASNRITILGQQIEIDAATQIVGAVDGEPLGGLGVGSDIEVSGFADSSGVLFARSIQPRRAVTPLRITGRVTNLDNAMRRMQIGGQVVNYSNATLTGLNGHALDSATVQVSAEMVGSTGEMLATDVSYVDLRVPGTVGDAADLQGWVTRYVSNTDFDVDGHAITTTSSTIMQGPLANISVVRLDAFVRVTGKVIGNGVVEAAEIVTVNSVNLGSVVNRIDSDRLFAPMWLTSPCELVDTSFSVDGVPAGRQSVQPGDRATIYANWSTNPFREKCYAVEVENSVVGRVEAVDPSSASFIVNGQRVWMSSSMFIFGRPGISWDVSGIATAEEARALLHVGDKVAISGHLTAEGDVVATGITVASANQGFRVTGLARDVDSVHHQLRLGNLQVDYSNASVAGFGVGGPADGDRVTLIATTEPAGGVQIAAGLKNSGAPLRGEERNLVYLQGLITKIAGADFAIEGRMTRPLPNPPVPGNGLERTVCDPSKLHENLRASALAAGGLDDGNPQRLFNVCPPGRRNDTYESLPNFAPEQFAVVTARIQALDLSHLTLQIAGARVGLNPAATLTSAQSGGGLVRTTPLRPQDLHVGDRVRVELPPLAGRLALVDTLWAGPAIDGGVDSVQGTIKTVSKPDVTVSNVTIRTNAGTAINYTYIDESTCAEVIGTAQDFWNSESEMNSGQKGLFRVTATGSFNGSVLDAA